MLRKTYIIWRDFADKMKKKNIAAYAASTAFFFFLSLVPMLMVISAILPYTPLTEDNLVTAVTEVTPEAVDAIATELIEEVYQKSAGALSIAIIATIWSAGKGVLALMRGLNAIHDVEEKRNYFAIRSIASFYTIVMLLVIILFLFVMVFGNQVVNLVLHRLPQLRALVSIYMEFRFLLVWVFLTVIFAAVYAYVPDKRLCFKEQIPGASFTAVVWSVFSWGFSLYVSRSGAYSIYGSLSIIVIVMLWMYLGMYIIMIGAYINRYFEPVNKVLMGNK
ncbi:MAG: YihY/virulence factor BrkB family protein [Butyrivibrio sp.]|nr:YihY/virulence factor BrkB family protein [Muribaculum sp.]MCM1553219.1 YihY/virulence factor BrkB family protein [Butyrivibrio sp.]